MAWDFLNTVATLGCGLACSAVTLYVRSTVREEAKTELPSLIRAELALFKGNFMAELNGTYVRSAGSTVTGAEIERNMGALSKQLGEYRDRPLRQ